MASSAPVAVEVIPSSEGSRNARLSRALGLLRAAGTSDGRAAVLRVLALTQDERALPEIVGAGRYGELLPTIRQALLEVFGDRKAVVEALAGQVRSSPAEKTLVWRWLSQSDRRRKEVALCSLGRVEVRFRHRKFRPFVVEAMRDDSLGLDALCALEGGGYPELVGEVIRLAESHDTGTLRGQAARILGGYKDDRLVPVLRELLLGKEHDVCRGAAEGLAALGTPAAKRALEEYAATGQGWVPSECTRALWIMAESTKAGLQK